MTNCTNSESHELLNAESSELQNDDPMILFQGLPEPFGDGKLPDPVPMRRSEFETQFEPKLDISYLDDLREDQLLELLGGAYRLGRIIKTIVVSPAVARQMADEWVAKPPISLLAKLLRMFGFGDVPTPATPLVSCADAYTSPYGDHRIMVARWSAPAVAEARS